MQKCSLYNNCYYMILNRIVHCFRYTSVSFLVRFWYSFGPFLPTLERSKTNGFFFINYVFSKILIVTWRSSTNNTRRFYFLCQRHYKIGPTTVRFVIPVPKTTAWTSIEITSPKHDIKTLINLIQRITVSINFFSLFGFY